MRFLSPEQVMQLLGISRSTLFVWIKSGDLQPLRKGRTLLFDEDTLMISLGRRPLVPVWVDRDIARGRDICSCKPFYWFEYLPDSQPQSDFLRMKVVGENYLVARMRFEEMQARNECVFLGSPTDVWRLVHVRQEVHPMSNISYLAVELRPHTAVTSIAAAR